MIWLKITVSVFFTGWVFSGQVDLKRLWQVVSNLDPTLLSVALLMHFTGLLLSARRWQKLLSFQEIRMPLSTLTDSYLVGSFFNLMMPTRIGGDMIRISDLNQVTRSVSRSASSVFAERLVGIWVLFGFAFLASLVRFPMAKENPAIWIGLGTGVAGIFGIHLLLYSKAVNLLVSLMPLKSLKRRITEKWNRLKEQITRLLKQPRAMGWTLAYSLLLQVNVVIHYWVIGLALDFDIPMLDYFYLIPVQLSLLMLPSINGIGVREASSVALLSCYGISPASAAAFGMIDLAIMILFGLMGWFRFIMRNRMGKE